MIHENQLSDAMRARLSKTFIYGISWDGFELVRGQVTGNRLWEMRKLAKKHRHHRVEKRNEQLGPVRGGFELMMQLKGHTLLAKEQTPRVLDAWLKYMTYSIPFSKITSDMFNFGAHLILIGWYSPRGELKFQSCSYTFPKPLSENELLAIAKEQMGMMAKSNPESLPADYWVRSSDGADDNSSVNDGREGLGRVT